MGTWRRSVAPTRWQCLELNTVRGAGEQEENREELEREPAAAAQRRPRRGDDGRHGRRPRAMGGGGSCVVVTCERRRRRVWVMCVSTRTRIYNKPAAPRGDACRQGEAAS